MTDAQKLQIQKYREDGLGHTAISRVLGLSLNTVKSYCRRNLSIQVIPIENPQENKDVCKQCEKLLPETKGKPKTFCCDKCRYTWWNNHRNNPSHKTACAFCGDLFNTHGNKTRKYCSHSCYIDGRYGGGSHD